MTNTDPAYIEKAAFRASALLWDVSREIENGIFVGEAARKRLDDCAREVERIKSLLTVTEAA